jgi:nitrous oxidase accessory protein NosD
MEKHQFSLVTLLVVYSVLISFSQIEAVKAQEPIYIRADGSVEGTDKIVRNGNVYTLMSTISVNASAIFGLKIEADNVVIDGSGYSIQGEGHGSGIEISNPSNPTNKTVYNVTVKNFNIQNFEQGIMVNGVGTNKIYGIIIADNNLTTNDMGIEFISHQRYVNNTIVRNNLTSNHIGISMYMDYYGDIGINQIIGNQITNNEIGMYFCWIGDWYSWKPNPFQMNNSISENNFINNDKNVVNGHTWQSPDCANIWDTGTSGNYWNKYNGTDSNNDGIGDMPYIIDENNQDNYPLMEPVEIETIPEFPSWTILPLIGLAILMGTVFRKKYTNHQLQN